LKVDKVEQQKTLLEWKREQYQSITNKLYDFQKKYFSSSSTWANEVSNVSASYSSNMISVTTSSLSTAGKIYIHDIVSLATSAKLDSSSSISSDPEITVNTDNLSDLGGKTLVVNLNGIEKVITFSDKTYTSSSDVRNEIQSQLNSMFGSGKVVANLNGDNITLSAPNSTIMIKTPVDGTDPGSALTFTSFASNRVDFNVSLANISLKNNPLVEADGKKVEFTINGKPFSFESTATLSDIMNTINASGAGVKMTYSSLTDKFTLVSTETGVASDIKIADTAGNLMNSLFGAGVKTAGTDAVVKLSLDGSTNPDDFITVTRSVNSINVNGTSIALKDMAAGAVEEGISINLSHDTDAIVNKIKDFVNDYNALLSELTSKISEEYDKDYPPLTTSQKEEMTEKEIELWEKKAKTGLLRNDIYLKQIAEELKRSFYTPIASLSDNTQSIGILSDLGISTTKYADKGKLTIDETKLKNALSSDPEKVIALFTQQSDKSFSVYATDEWQQERYNEEGVFHRISDIISFNLNKTGNKKGALINLVGSPTDSYTGETEYSKRIKDLKEKIEDLEDKLAREEEGYWRKFTAMESALAKLNQQNSWLMSLNGNSN
jgi:flagellar hook-associated protein 2